MAKAAGLFILSCTFINIPVMTIESILLESSATDFVMLGWLFFGGIYFAFAAFNRLLTRLIFPAIGFGGLLDPRPLAPGQLKREWLFSATTIFLYGLGMLAPWGMLQLGWAHLAQDPGTGHIVLESLALFIWNEAHFYVNHRLLHTKWLMRFHLPHHRSIITTPWSTYSLHPVEALMLGNVLLLPMVVHDFSAMALLSVPIFSLIVNNIGHSNYNFLPWADKDRWWLNSSRRHHLHHACYHGNYGFMFPFMDRIFGTVLPADAADVRFAEWQRKSS